MCAVRKTSKMYWTWGGCWYGVRSSCYDLGLLLLKSLNEKKVFVSTLKLSDLQEVLGDAVDFPSRSILIFQYFCLCFGEDMMRKPMIPESAPPDLNAIITDNIVFLSREQQLYWYLKPWVVGDWRSAPLRWIQPNKA
jgi:hypothetical protein